MSNNINIHGKRVVLRSLMISDTSTLLNWRNNKTFREFCSTRRNIVTEEDFFIELQNDFANDKHLLYLIEKKSNNIPIGTIFSYRYNPTDGHLYISMFLDDGYRKSVYGAESFSIFILYLFISLELFKIYTEVYSSNTQVIRALLAGGFEIEGRLIGHRVNSLGVRVDLIIMSFKRQKLDWLKDRVSVLTDDLLCI